VTDNHHVFIPFYHTRTDSIHIEEIPREILSEVSVKVNQEKYTLLLEWCNLYCRDTFYIPDMSIMWELFGSFSTNVRLYFHDTVDAMYFKLRWVDNAFNR
jgi:hypothetical protein